MQVGTNLSFVGLADRLEAELGKPVVAINAATLWHALREHGIDDQVSASGSPARALRSAERQPLVATCTWS